MAISGIEVGCEFGGLLNQSRGFLNDLPASPSGTESFLRSGSSGFTRRYYLGPLQGPAARNKCSMECRTAGYNHFNWPLRVLVNTNALPEGERSNSLAEITRSIRSDEFAVPERDADNSVGRIPTNRRCLRFSSLKGTQETDDIGNQQQFDDR